MSPTISISFCILFLSINSFAVFAFLIASAAGPDKVSRSFLSFSSNSFEFVFLFKQCITPIHSPETSKGEHKTE